MPTGCLAVLLRMLPLLLVQRYQQSLASVLVLLLRHTTALAVAAAAAAAAFVFGSTLAIAHRAALLNSAASALRRAAAATVVVAVVALRMLVVVQVHGEGHVLLLLSKVPPNWLAAAAAAPDSYSRCAIVPHGLRSGCVPFLAGCAALEAAAAAVGRQKVHYVAVAAVAVAAAFCNTHAMLLHEVRSNFAAAPAECGAAESAAAAGGIQAHQISEAEKKEEGSIKK